MTCREVTTERVCLTLTDGSKVAAVAHYAYADAANGDLTKEATRFTDASGDTVYPASDIKESVVGNCCPELTEESVTAGKAITGAGSVPAGLKTVTINSITGINVVAGAYQIGNGRRSDSISLDATQMNCFRGVLPEIKVTGTGEWQWIGIKAQ